MGAFDLYLPVPGVITNFNAFLGGLGRSRQGAASQQAALDTQANIAEGQAWSGAIQQATQALRPLALAPFIPQLSQLGPTQQMIAGNLLGLPGLTQAGAQQAAYTQQTAFQQRGFENQSQLQSRAFDQQVLMQGLRTDAAAQQQQGYFAARSQLEQEQYDREYEQAYGFTPAGAAQTGQQIFGSLSAPPPPPPAGGVGPPAPQPTFSQPQVSLLSSAGLSPEAFSRMSEQERAPFYRSIAVNQAKLQQAQQQGMMKTAAMSAYQRELEVDSAISGYENGTYEISDPTLRQQVGELSEARNAALGDEGLTGSNLPVQQALVQQTDAQLRRLFSDGLQRGAVKQKINPVQQLNNTNQAIVEWSKKQGLKGAVLGTPDGKSRYVEFTNADKPARVPNHGYQPGDMFEADGKGSGRWVSVDQHGVPRPMTWGTSKDEGLDFQKVFMDLVNAEQSKIDSALKADMSGKRDLNELQVDLNAVGKNAIKFMDVYNASRARQLEADRLLKHQKNFWESPGGQILDRLQQMGPAELQQIGMPADFNQRSLAEQEQLTQQGIFAYQALQAQAQAAQGVQRAAGIAQQATDADAARTLLSTQPPPPSPAPPPMLQRPTTQPSVRDRYSASARSAATSLRAVQLELDQIKAQYPDPTKMPPDVRARASELIQQKRNAANP